MITDKKDIVEAKLNALWNTASHLNPTLLPLINDLQVAFRDYTQSKERDLSKNHAINTSP